MKLKFIDERIKYQNQYKNQFNIDQQKYNPSGLIRIYERFKQNIYDILIMEKGEIDLKKFMNNNNQHFNRKLRFQFRYLNLYNFYINNNLQIEILNLKILLKQVINLNLLILDQQNRLQQFSKHLKQEHLSFRHQIIDVKIDYDFSVDICVFYEIL
ncbi:unnamed protein product [Paramecium sonneborni]|uniref:Uncharacterized protein n=1 Tax=Paramecium sonneborni TaxID=65129 RepID=A0A8S1NRF7_9CILI|nr:unnamed protein product [Paramecium sonneborni]